MTEAVTARKPSPPCPPSSTASAWPDTRSCRSAAARPVHQHLQRARHGTSRSEVTPRPESRERAQRPDQPVIRPSVADRPACSRRGYGMATVPQLSHRGRGRRRASRPFADGETARRGTAAQRPRYIRPECTQAGACPDARSIFIILVRGARSAGGRPVRPVRGTAVRLAVCGQCLALMRWQRAGRAGHSVPSGQGRGTPGHHPAWRSALPGDHRPGSRSTWAFGHCRVSSSAGMRRFPGRHAAGLTALPARTALV